MTEKLLKEFQVVSVGAAGCAPQWERTTPEHLVVKSTQHTHGGGGKYFSLFQVGSGSSESLSKL